MAAKGLQIALVDGVIRIGKQKARWDEAKVGLASVTDESLAKLLLDLYFYWLAPKVGPKNNKTVARTPFAPSVVLDDDEVDVERKSGKGKQKAVPKVEIKEEEKGVKEEENDDDEVVLLTEYRLPNKPSIDSSVNRSGAEAVEFATNRSFMVEEFDDADAIASVCEPDGSLQMAPTRVEGTLSKNRTSPVKKDKPHPEKKETSPIKAGFPSSGNEALESDYEDEEDNLNQSDPDFVMADSSLEEDEWLDESFGSETGVREYDGGGGGGSSISGGGGSDGDDKGSFRRETNGGGGGHCAIWKLRSQGPVEPDKRDPVEPDKKRRPDYAFCSSVTPQEFWKKKYLEHFEELENEEEVACRLCEERIISATRFLADHLKCHHGLAKKGESIQPLFCDKHGCDESIIFVTHQEFLQHNKIIHYVPKSGKKLKEEDGEVCFLCGEFVKSLAVHMKNVHTTKETVLCPHLGCGKHIAKENIKNHMKCHTPGVCPYPDCNVRFKSKNSIKTHIRSVHEAHLQKKLQCPHCPQIYKKPIHLRRHINEMHVMGKIYSCPEVGCNQVFRRKCTLHQHGRLHLNLKPFQCPWCDFTGAQQNNIRSHALTTHREEFLFAQHNGERYWRRTDPSSGTEVPLVPQMPPFPLSVPPPRPQPPLPSDPHQLLQHPALGPDSTMAFQQP